MNNPLVSVVMPAYNAERYIRAALESVLAQTYLPIEIIVVDDSSTDSTRAIAAEYVPYGVIVVPQRHRGAAAARNRGVQATRGEYIQYMDADDILDRHCIEKKIGAVAKCPECMIYGRVEPFTIKPAAEMQDSATSEICDNAIKLIKDMYVERKYFFGAYAFLLPKSNVTQCGEWTEDLHTSDDYDYVARLITQFPRVCFVPEAIYHYRSVKGSLRAVTTTTRAKSALRAYELAVAHLSGRYPELFDKNSIAQGLFDTLIYTYPFSKPYEAEVLTTIRDLVGGRRLRCDAIGGPRMQLLASLVGWRFARYVGLMLGDLRRLRPL